MKDSRMLLAALAALAACGPSDPRAGHDHVNADLRTSPLAVQPGPRRIVEPEWESIFEVGGAEEDTTLLMPVFLAADANGVWVYDAARRQVGRLSGAGRLEWWFGGRGRGPDEFMNVRDIESDGAGRLWVLDTDNARITVLSSVGRAESRIPLADLPYADQLVPMRDRGAILLAVQPRDPLFVLDLQGRLLRRHGLGWDDFARLHPLAAQTVAATAPDGRHFAVAFRVGDGFFAFRDGRPLPYHGLFVEHVDFPRVSISGGPDRQTAYVPPSTPAARSLALERDRLYVHFGGRTEHRNALLDIYELGTGRYLRTLRLPHDLVQAAVGGGTLYGIHGSPYPALGAWRLRDVSLLE
jgi:hypothetical protein